MRWEGHFDRVHRVCKGPVACRKLKRLNEDQCGFTEETGMERTRYETGVGEVAKGLWIKNV